LSYTRAEKCCRARILSDETPIAKQLNAAETISVDARAPGSAEIRDKFLRS